MDPSTTLFTFMLWVFLKSSMKLPFLKPGCFIYLLFCFVGSHCFLHSPLDPLRTFGAWAIFISSKSISLALSIRCTCIRPCQLFSVGDLSRTDDMEQSYIYRGPTRRSDFIKLFSEYFPMVNTRCQSALSPMLNAISAISAHSRHWEGWSVMVFRVCPVPNKQCACFSGDTARVCLSRPCLPPCTLCCQRRLMTL